MNFTTFVKTLKSFPIGPGQCFGDEDTFVCPICNHDHFAGDVNREYNQMKESLHKLWKVLGGDIVDKHLKIAYISPEALMRCVNIDENKYPAHIYHKFVETSSHVLLIKICDKMAKIKLQYYDPKHLIIWKGYYDLLNGERKYNNVHKILGLEVHMTELPEVLEVY